jgi:hypothetical protein
VTKQGGTTFNFVSDGIEAALEQAREAAGGARLFEGVGPDDVELEGTRVVEAAGVTHLRYRVVK